MLGDSSGWMLKQSMGPRIRPCRVFGTWRSKTVRRMYRGRLRCGETTQGFRNTGTSAARKWSGDSTQTSWQGLFKAGLHGIKICRGKCAYTFLQKSLLRRSLSASIIMKWSLSYLICDANALTSYVFMLRLGKSQSSTINLCLPLIWLFLDSKKIVIDLC